MIRTIQQAAALFTAGRLEQTRSRLPRPFSRVLRHHHGALHLLGPDRLPRTPLAGRAAEFVSRGSGPPALATPPITLTSLQILLC